MLAHEPESASTNEAVRLEFNQFTARPNIKTAGIPFHGSKVVVLYCHFDQSIVVSVIPRKCTSELVVVEHEYPKATVPCIQNFRREGALKFIVIQVQVAQADRVGSKVGR